MLSERTKFRPVFTKDSSNATEERAAIDGRGNCEVEHALIWCFRDKQESELCWRDSDICEAQNHRGILEQCLPRLKLPSRWCIWHRSTLLPLRVTCTWCYPASKTCLRSKGNPARPKCWRLISLSL